MIVLPQLTSNLAYFPTCASSTLAPFLQSPVAMAFQQSLPASSSLGQFAMPASEEPTKQQIATARQQLKSWGEDQYDAALLKKYFVLKRSLGSSRMTKQAWASSRQKREYSEGTERLLYVVPKSHPEDRSVDEYVASLPAHMKMHPDLLATHPEDVDITTVWFITANADPKYLGSRQLRHITRVANVTETVTPVASSAAIQDGAPPAAPPAIEEPQDPPAKRARPLLERKSSTSDTPVSSLKAEYTSIAVRSQEAAKAGCCVYMLVC